MTQISDTDTAIVRELSDCRFPGVTVQSGPHEWDGAYVNKLLAAAPTIVVAFLGAEPYSDTKTSTTLALEGKWDAYVVVGWNGRSDVERRIGADQGYDLLARAAGAIHNVVLHDANGARLTIASVEGLEVLTTAALDKVRLWIASIAITLELPLELPPDCTGALDDFLKIRGPLELPDPAADVDISVDLPQ